MLTKQSELSKLESRQSYLEKKILESEKERLKEAEPCTKETVDEEEELDSFHHTFGNYCCMETQEYEDCLSDLQSFLKKSSVDYYQTKIVSVYTQLDKLKFNREKIDPEDFLEKKYNCFEELASIKSMLESEKAEVEWMMLGLQVLEEYYFEFNKVCEHSVAFSRYWLNQSRMLDQKSSERHYRSKLESLQLKYAYYVKRLEYIESRLQQYKEK